MATSSSLLNRAIIRVSGVWISSAVAISREIHPTSVVSPLAVTTPVA